MVLEFMLIALGVVVVVRGGEEEVRSSAGVGLHGAEVQTAPVGT